MYMAKGFFSFAPAALPHTIDAPGSCNVANANTYTSMGGQALEAKPH